ILENPRDDLSWMRVLQLFDGVGPGRARQALECLQGAENAAEALRKWRAPAGAQEPIESLARLFSDLAGSNPELELTAQIERVRRLYARLLERHYEQPEMRPRDLDQLELLARQAPDRATFLADLTLDPPASTGDLAGRPLLDEEYVVLSTIHSAK